MAINAIAKMMTKFIISLKKKKTLQIAEINTNGHNHTCIIDQRRKIVLVPSGTGSQKADGELRKAAGIY